MLVITSLNAHFYHNELSEMYRLRHRVLVEKKGWETIRKTDGLEKDEFDDEHTIYLLWKNYKNEVCGCVRMTPSIFPNLTSTHFPQLCNLEAPRQGPDTYDLSRLVVEAGTPGNAKSAMVASKLICGFIEAGLAMGLTEVIAVMSQPYVTLSLSMGWDMRPLGTPAKVEGETTIAVRIPVNEQQLTRARRSRNYDKTVLNNEDCELLRVTHRMSHHKLVERAA